MHFYEDNLTDLLKIQLRTMFVVPQYYVKDSQRPIVAKDIFMLVQEEMIRKQNLTSGVDGKKKEYIPASMHFQVFVPMHKVLIITGELHGTIGKRNPTVWRCCTK